MNADLLAALGYIASRLNELRDDVEKAYGSDFVPYITSATIEYEAGALGRFVDPDGIGFTFEAAE